MDNNNNTGRIAPQSSNHLPRNNYALLNKGKKRKNWTHYKQLAISGSRQGACITNCDLSDAKQLEMVN
jgi:hypothetical protein